MLLNLSCPACGSRFALSDDLLEQRVTSLVSATCPDCNAQIAVDSSEPPTKPSHEAPLPSPTPEPIDAPGLAAGATPLPVGNPTRTPMTAEFAQSATEAPLSTESDANATETPLSTESDASATETPLSTQSDASATETPLSTQSDASPTSTPLTISMTLSMRSERAASEVRLPTGSNSSPTETPLPSSERERSLTLGVDMSAMATPLGFNTRPPPRPAHAPHLTWPSTLESEPELIEAEEITPNSSDVPSLDALMGEGRPLKPVHRQRQPDDFLLNLSEGTQGILGPPTIDVSSLGAPEPPRSAGFERPGLDHPLPSRLARTGTMPLFDMSAVLPPANAPLRTASTLPAQLERTPPANEGPPNARGTRRRSSLIAPDEPTPRAPARRAGAVIWFALFAAAMSIAVVVAVRTRPAQSNLEPTLPFRPAVHTNAALPANPATPEAQGTVEASSAALAPGPIGSASATQSPAPIVTPEAALAPVQALSGKRDASRVAAQKTSALGELVTDRPALDLKPVEAAPEPDTEFDRGAARAALESAASSASSCRKQGDPSGTASMTVTFATSGRVTSATVQGPPFAGTATGGCIASAMRRASVPPFSGDYVTVTKTIAIE